MIVVVDANVIFSALLGRGNTFNVFESNKIFQRFEFVAPEFLFTEIGKRMDKILAHTKLNKDEVSQIFGFLKDQINFVPASDFLDKLEEAVKINKKDSPYIALALKLNCPIFSGDKRLKQQNIVKVYSPKELLDLLSKE